MTDATTAVSQGTAGGQTRGHGFGVAPVFLAAISTILGAILFLRFVYAVGQVGVLGGLAMILIGHAITIPTGMAVAEIVTNLKVEGGGEYYIISRSFGLGWHPMAPEHSEGEWGGDATRPLGRRHHRCTGSAGARVDSPGRPVVHRRWERIGGG